MLSCDTDPATGVIEITVDGAITRAVAALMPAEIRVFPLAALDEARAWVCED
ncbi:MAG TPA: STAS/SEC14 domain-containing protein [Sphingomonas sp.]|nr:STAS/SEC14 domain-containing protein [Sphingomonas sp.]